MAKEYRFYAIKEANADVESTSAVINPLLDAAKITTIEVNGKPLPATSDEVPTAAKITAYAKTVKSGAGDAQMSAMSDNNTLLAAQAKTFETRAVTAETNSATVTRENVALTDRITVLEGSVQKLSAENAELITLRKAANTEAGRVTSESNAVNSEISRQALAFNCLSDLKGADGKLLPSTATSEQRQAAAELIPVADKLKAIGGAVNSAVQRTQVSLASMPAAGATATGAPAKEELKGRARFNAAVAKDFVAK